jgi:tetratricopeptide (TPR) repeat protein
MRTFEEITSDLDHPINRNNAEALLRFSEELDALATPEAAAFASRSRGVAHALRGEQFAALQQLHHALSLYESLGDRSGMARVNSSIGTVHFRTCDYSEALRHYHGARILYEELGDHIGVATMTSYMGDAHNSTGSYPAALEHYHSALAINEEHGDRSGVANATGNIGNVHDNTGNFAEALSHYHRALALHEELGDRIGLARVTGNIGNVYNNTGDYSAALEYFQRALSLHEELGDRIAVAMVSSNIGLVYKSIGDYPKALHHLHRGLSLAEALGDRKHVAGATCNIGNVLRMKGDFPAALEHFHRALALCDELGDTHYAANITCSIGNVYLETSDYPVALTHYHQALALYEQLGVRSSVASVVESIGLVQFIAGDYESALSHFRQTLAVYEELGVRSGVANVTGNIGNVCNITGDRSAALSHYQRALAIHEELGARGSVARDTGNILNAYVNLGSNAEALALLQTMDAMQIDEPSVRVEREQQRAILQERSGDLDLAMVTLQRALSEANAHGLRALSAASHKSLRDLAQKRNDFAGYIEHNNEYTRITEEINGKDTATKLAMQAKQREIDAERKEHEKHLAVLHSTLPKEVADRVARGEVVNDHYENASVIFLDIVGFTDISSHMSSQDVILLLDDVFSQCDAICAKYGVTKIKTIGDSYMCVSFDSVVNAALAAMEMSLIQYTIQNTESNPSMLQYRIGVHCGPVTAGVIGKERMQYDVWGDTVNVASRMESAGEPGRVHVSEAFALKLEEPLVTRHSSLVTIDRGSIEIKGKGPMQTYWLQKSYAALSSQ